MVAAASRDLVAALVILTDFVAAWIHDIYRRHADVKTRGPDREAQAAAAADRRQGEGRRQASRGSAASTPGGRGEDRAQAGDPPEDRHRRHRPGGTDVANPDQPPLARGADPSLKRPDDRALFGLDLEPSADAAGADKSEPAGAPITSQQKQLLAELVEEHPRLARELGVNPDEPGLEALGKAKAGLLIQAVLDRVNPQAPPDER